MTRIIALGIIAFFLSSCTALWHESFYEPHLISEHQDVYSEAVSHYPRRAGKIVHLGTAPNLVNLRQGNVVLEVGIKPRHGGMWLFGFFTPPVLPAFWGMRDSRDFEIIAEFRAREDSGWVEIDTSSAFITLDGSDVAHKPIKRTKWTTYGSLPFVIGHDEPTVIIEPGQIVALHFDLDYESAGESFVLDFEVIGTDVPNYSPSIRFEGGTAVLMALNAISSK